MLCKEFHHFWLPKRGNTREEYEDAAASNATIGRLAIADGASDSSYAGPWARLLVEGFIQASALGLAAWIAPLKKRWLKQVAAGPVPWYTETKIADGAFATFLGLCLEKKTAASGKQVVVWSAVAVGDSCVFHVRNDRCIHKFPLERSEDFDNSPGLVCSRSQTGELEKTGLERIVVDNVCQSGDRLWLMTDALAAWFLRRDAEGAKPWEELEPLPELSEQEQATQFEFLVERHRDAHDLRNDDVTMLVIGF